MGLPSARLHWQISMDNYAPCLVLYACNDLVVSIPGVIFSSYFLLRF